MTDSEREILIKWLDGPFCTACIDDVKRLEESILMIQIGTTNGDSPEKCMGVAIATFVHGLIHRTPPVTVPNDSN